MKVLNLGSLNIDKTYLVKNIVSPKETIEATDFYVSCGGKGLNQSIAISKAGVKCFHAGAVGEEDGEILINTLKKAGVNIDYLQRSKTASGHAIIQIDKNGQNCIIVYAGANNTITKDYIDKVLDKFSCNDILILQNEISNIDYAIKEAAKKKMKIILNPSPYNDRIKKLDLNKIDYFMLNEIEAMSLAEVNFLEINEIIKKLKKKYIDASFILTVGESGVYWFDKKDTIHQNAFCVDAIDTTGAGDTFSGYFIAGLANNIPIKDNLEISSAASAISITRKGASSSIPTLKEVQNYIKQEIK